MNIREINLLFSEVVFTKILDYISDEELESINDSLKSIEYKSTDPNPNNKQATQVSKNKEIFKSLYFLKLAETIKEEFINFKNNTLHYVNVLNIQHLGQQSLNLINNQSGIIIQIVFIVVYFILTFLKIVVNLN